MTAGQAAEAGFFNRMKNDATLTALLGTGVRIFDRLPDVTTTASGFPRITYRQPSDSPRRPGFHSVRMKADVWVWEAGTTGGKRVQQGIEARLFALFDEQHWTYEGFRLYSYVLTAADGVAGENKLRRILDVAIEASAL